MGKLRQPPYHMNGVAIFDILNSWSFNINKIMTFIIVDYEKPICMDLSSRKITKPHSDMRSSGIFASTTKSHVLGITNNVGGILTIKPLALWNIISEDDCDALVSL